MFKSIWYYFFGLIVISLLYTISSALIGIDVLEESKFGFAISHLVLFIISFSLIIGFYSALFSTIKEKNISLFELWFFSSIFK